MSFPRYEALKPAGTGWLQEVPAHWQVVPNKAFLQAINELVGTDSSGFRLLSLTLYGVILRDIESGKGKYPAEFATYKAVEADDLVFCLFDVDETPRTVGLARQAGMITGAYEVLRCLPSALPSYVCYFYLHVDAYKGLRPWYTGLRKVVRPDTFMSIKLALPPLEEQKAITLFLDRETSKIDALIEEQRRLIELLKEKRQAVISHAVTKGLNPRVLMKDSGYAELGLLPSHWRVTPLGYFSRLHRGHDLTNDQQEEGLYPVVTSGGITGFHSKYIAKAPGVVTGRYGSTGRLFYLEQDYWPHNTSLYVSDFFHNDPRFVWYSLQAVNFESHSAKSAVPGIDRNDLHVLPVAVPPKEEQPAIVTHLDNLLQEVDILIAEALRATALLQERRSALISAAVTGKIDVRNYVPKEAA